MKVHPERKAETCDVRTGCQIQLQASFTKSNSVIYRLTLCCTKFLNIEKFKIDPKYQILNHT